MIDHPMPANAEDEIDVLDLLVIIAENIKLLILGPLLAGMLAFGAVSLWPATYESGFTLQGEKKLGPVKEPIEILTSEKVKQLVTSPAVLADAAKNLQSSGQGDWAALLTSGAVSAHVPRGTTHVQVSVKTQDPQAAQAVAQVLLKATMDNSHPKDDALASLQATVQNDQAALANARLLASRIGATINSTQGVDPVLAQAYSALLGAMPGLVFELEVSQLKLQGLTAADVIAQPILPTVPASLKPKLVTILAILTTGLALLLWVFVRKAFQGAVINSESATKIARIRQALGLKARA